LHIHKKYLFVIPDKALVLNDILYEYILSVVHGYPEVMGSLHEETQQDFPPVMLSMPRQGECRVLLHRFRRTAASGTAACKILWNCADSYIAPSFGWAGLTCRR
jgi:hypothetical protein